MRSHGGAAGAVNLPSNRAMSAIGAKPPGAALASDAEWRDAMDREDEQAADYRPLGAARGIFVGMLLSIPLWTLFMVAAYLLV